MASPEKSLEGLNAILHSVRIADVMTKPAKTVKVKSRFSMVEEMFVENRIRHLPVVDEDEKLIGMISQRDVYRAISPRRFVDGKVRFHEDIIVDKDGFYEKDSLDEYILKNFMQKNPDFLSEERPLGDAIHMMVSNKSGCVPIVNKDHHVRGIITRFDILKFADSIYE